MPQKWSRTQATNTRLIGGVGLVNGPGNALPVFGHRFRPGQAGSIAIAVVKAHPQFVYGSAWLAQWSDGTPLSTVTTAVRDDPEVPAAWALFLLRKFGDEFDPESRWHFIQKLVAGPGYETQAFVLMRDAAWLTDAEDAALYGFWWGTQPTIAEEVALGYHPRAKGIPWP